MPGSFEFRGGFTGTALLAVTGRVDSRFIRVGGMAACLCLMLSFSCPVFWKVVWIQPASAVRQRSRVVNPLM